jgi:hypothetical protein
MYFCCPRRLDKLLPSAFPISDATRFQQHPGVTAEHVLDTVMRPFAEKYAHLVPPLSGRTQSIGR